MGVSSGLPCPFIVHLVSHFTESGFDTCGMRCYRRESFLVFVYR